MNVGAEEIMQGLKSFFKGIAEEVYSNKIEELTEQVISHNLPVLNLTQVCKITGLSKSTIYSNICQKKIAYYKLNNKKLYFKWEDVKLFIMNEEHYYKAKSTLRMEAESMSVIDNI